MASFAGRRRAAPAWSIDDASTFAALKEFKLLQFLSTDKKALTTARRLGLNFSHSQPQSPISAPAGGGGSASTARPPVAATASVTEAPNARQRRSAARSARRHAARQAQLCSRTMLAILFMVRLRRIVGGTFGVDAEITTVLAKRGTGDRPPSSSSNSSSRSASSTSHHAGQPQGECVAASPRMPHGQGRLDKRPKGGMLAGFLLR